MKLYPPAYTYECIEFFPEMLAKHFQVEEEMERKENYLESEKLFLFLFNHCLNLKKFTEYNAK